MLQRIIIPWGIGMAILGIVIMLICNLMNSYEPKEKWGAGESSSRIDSSCHYWNYDSVKLSFYLRKKNLPSEV